MEEWSKLTNTEIRLKIASMEQEYEAIKNKINNLMNDLESIDVKYNKAISELNKRTKK